MARWRRFLILALFLATLGGTITAIIFEELAYIASTKPASDRQSDKHSDHDRNKQEWPSQIAVATDWLTERREWLNVLFAGLVALFTFTLSRSTSRLGALASIQAGDMQNLLGVAKDNAAASASQVKAIEAQERVMREQAKIMAANLDLAKKAAEAAQTSADAALSQVRIMIARESPVLYLTGWKLEPAKQGIGAVGIIPNTDYFPALIARNNGRSTLQIQELCIETMFGDRATVFDGMPKYEEIATLGTMIRADDETTLRVAHLVRFTENEVKALQNRDMLFWIYGFVRYYNQYIREVWDAGFSAIIYPDGGWVRFDLPNYAYHRRYEANSSNPAPSSA